MVEKSVHKWSGSGFYVEGGRLQLMTDIVERKRQ